ncbi:MAG TPA: right-handed parallel beta-helix repeat-containing protein [Terracidiphilus sp.]
MITHQTALLCLLLISAALFAQPAAGKATPACDWSFPDVVACFNAIGDGVTNDTAALRAAIVYGETHDVRVHVPRLAFSIVPADSFQDEGRTNYKGAFPITSNMHIKAEPGAVFRIRKGVSTSAAPVPMAMFYTNGVHSNISIENLTMDMNGPNNRISPAGRPASVSTISCDGTSCSVSAPNAWSNASDRKNSMTVHFWAHLWGFTGAFAKPLNGRAFLIASVTPAGFSFTANLQGAAREKGAFAEALARLNQPQIFVTGSVNGPGRLPAAALSNVLLQNDTFVDGPGVSSIVMAESNSPGAVLGTGWRVLNNTFTNNGIDSDDHSTIFGWANNVVVDGNKFTSSTPVGVSLFTGAPTISGPHVAYEVHGSNTTFNNNTVHNYYQGLWLADNLNSPVVHTVIQHNRFDSVFVGAAVYDQSAAEKGIAGVLIEDNDFNFDDGGHPANPEVDRKAAVIIGSIYGISGVVVRNNRARKTGTGFASSFALLIAPTVEGQITKGITISNNSGTGLANGVTIAAHNGRLEDIAAVDNDWSNLTPAGTVTRAIGYFVRNLGPSGSTISGLTLGGGSVTNSRPSSRETCGILIQGGSPNVTITDLTLNPTKFSGIGGANYEEVGKPDIQRRHGAVLR